MLTTRLAATLFLLHGLVATRVQDLSRRAARSAEGDEGLTTLEWVVLALGLFTVAGIAVAVITTAVQSRLDQIR